MILMFLIKVNIFALLNIIINLNLCNELKFYYLLYLFVLRYLLKY